MSLYEDQERVLKDCTERFERLGIAYMLTGSMAMVDYAMMRMTNDIDIVMQLKYNDAQRIINAFEPEYYVPHGRVGSAIETNLMFNLLHQRSLVKIDCVMLKNTEFQKVAFGNRYDGRSNSGAGKSTFQHGKPRLRREHYPDGGH